jgi:tetratricopeptide (TPR) repeat protein
VSVVIADFDNRTADPAFDRTLEPMLKRALEGAAFISAYDRNGVARTLGVKVPERLNAVAARELAVRQGVGTVLSGSIDRQGAGYRIAMNAVQTVTGKVITSTEASAPTKDQVLPVATRLVTTVRKALGDDSSESAQMFAMASLSATSLDVVRLYAAAQEASSSARFDEARQFAARALQLDPKFGVGYQLLAVASRNLGRSQEAERYITEGLRYVDGMTERERYSTRGFYYRITGDYPQCVKEYGDLIARYSADVVGHNQLALCLTQLRDLRRAVGEMRKVVDLLPRRVLFRDNLALYSNYAGDFVSGEREARTVLNQEPDVYATLALAFAQLGQGQLAAARATYDRLQTMNAVGASLSASGLGDVAMLQGQFADAVRILRRGAAQDLAASNADRAAAKLIAVSNAELSRGRSRAAVDAAAEALKNSSAVKIRFLAARAFLQAGDTKRAQPIITDLTAELQAEPQAYAKILEGDAALQAGNARAAVKALTEANALLDTWIGHFDLGRAYLAARAYTQADSEFDRCLTRRGEALALFLDEEPTYAYLPNVYYYQGQVREGLKTAGFAESYRKYLEFRGASTEDPLRDDVRRRAGS